MKQRLFWKNPGYKKRPSLKKNIECDYLIVGGGITGVALAYFLGRRGKDVVLIKRIAALKGFTEEEVANNILMNYQRVFG